jgi:hypothetical protein
MPASSYTPDMLNAYLRYVRECPAIQAVAGGERPRVSRSLNLKSESNPDGWDLSKETALVMRLAGGTGESPMFLRPILSTRSYGPSPHQARDLWRRLHTWIVAGTFTRANTVVYGAELASGPDELEEPQTGWFFVLASYRPFLSEVSL